MPVDIVDIAARLTVVSDYAFGDTDLAGERLRILDRVFAPTAEALLTELTELTELSAFAVAPRRIADLGCGPGATTRRLATRFPAARVIGIDASASFCAEAAAALPTADFVHADVTEPLPGDPYDLIYARFLLAHLSDVPGAIRGWLGALGPGGVLVLEETESITSADPWFARYERLSVARVGAAGADVYAGPRIRSALPTLSVDVLIDRVVELDNTAGEAAAMFWRNLVTWGEAAVAQGLIAEPDRAALLGHLRARDADTTRGRFVWEHHQTVLRSDRAHAGVDRRAA